MVLMRVCVMISGRGSNMEALVRGSEGRDYEVLGVLSHGEVEGLSRARELGVETRVLPRGVEEGEREALRALEAMGCEFLVLAGYMRVLSKDFVRKWRGRSVNIHPSLLPLYKGLDTHERVLRDGAKEHGCSVHWLSEGVDEGEVIGQRRLRVRSDHTVESLRLEVLAEEHVLLVDVVGGIAEKRRIER